MLCARDSEGAKLSMQAMVGYAIGAGALILVGVLFGLLFLAVRPTNPTDGPETASAVVHLFFLVIYLVLAGLAVGATLVIKSVKGRHRLPAIEPWHGPSATHRSSVQHDPGLTLVPGTADASHTRVESRLSGSSSPLPAPRKAADDARRPVRASSASPTRRSARTASSSSTRSPPSTSAGNKTSDEPLARRRPTARRRRDSSPPRRRATATRAGRRTARRILFESNRSGENAALGHRPGRRRGPAAHDDQHRGVERHLVAGRQARRLRLGRLPGVHRQAVRRERQAEQEEAGGDREEPGEGEGVHEALLPPLGRLRRGQAAAPVRRRTADGRRAAGRHPRRPRRLPDVARRSASATTSPSRPTASTWSSPPCPDKDEAWSTNYDLCRVPIDNRSTKWETLTKDNQAADSAPRSRPDGKKLAYRAQKKAGYEADKWDILVVDVRAGRDAVKGKPKNVTAVEVDVSVERVRLARQTARRCFSPPTTRGARTIFDDRTLDGARGRSEFAEGGQIGSLSRQHATATGWRSQQAAMNQPAEGRASTGPARERGHVAATSVDANDEAARRTRPAAAGERRGARSRAAKMQMWILKPPGLRPEEEMAGRLPRPRRAAGGVGGRLELPLEPAAVGGAGLRRRPAEPARLDRLRPEVRRRDHRRLGRQVLPTTS